MEYLIAILKDKEYYRNKLKQMPAEELQKHADVLRVVVLPDEDVVDALIATYFEREVGESPLDTDNRIPESIMPQFVDDRQFFHFVSDMAKRVIG